MSLLEIGRTGASKQSWRSPGPRALLKKLMDKAKDPHNGKVLFKEFVAAILPAAVRDAFENDDDERRLVAVIEYWFTNNHHSMLALYPRPGDEKRKAAAEEQRLEKQQTIRRVVKEKIREQAEILLLDWVMPNGKPIGDCTGNEIRKLDRKVSPLLEKIAARVKPNELVRDVLSETELRKMWGK